MDKRRNFSEKPTSQKEEYIVVSFSGGKDSTAMLLGMIERGMKIDCILFCDTGLEFPAMYDHIDKVERDIGRSITRVRSPYTYEYLMFDAAIKRKNLDDFISKFGRNYTGYGWPGPRMRWCTSRLKDVPREQFLQRLRQKYDVKEYVGIAADEQYRLERSRNQSPNHVHPLVDWGMTEDDCLRYCFKCGYDWGGLYQHFKRVSCWCCPLQSLEELRQLYQYYPDHWAKLKDWDKRTWRNFRADYSVEELEVRFLLEKEWELDGNSIKSRTFFNTLRQRLEEHHGIK